MKKRTIAIIGLALCSNAAWADCTKNFSKSTPDADFEVHADGTVTHKTTSLMWKICSEGYEYKAGSCTQIAGGTETFTWAAALNHVSELNKTKGFAGYKDWRLPNVKELASIVEKACDEPAINSKIFPDTPNTNYWSASPDASESDRAWYRYFGTGNNYSYDKNSTYYVRLVRTP